MLIDWPDRKKELIKRLVRSIDVHRASTSPVAMIAPRMMLSEGRRVLFVNPDGSKDEMELRSHDASIAVGREELLSEEFTFNEVGEQLGSQLGQQMDKELLEKISQLPPH